MTTAEIFKTPIFLAPMAGVTDTAFRVLVRELIGDDFARKNLLMFSEMVSAAGVHYRNEKTLAMLETVAAELLFKFLVPTRQSARKRRFI